MASAPRKTYPDAVPGSRAKGRGAGERKIQRWGPAPQKALCLTRKDAERRFPGRPVALYRMPLEVAKAVREHHDEILRRMVTG